MACGVLTYAAVKGANISGATLCVVLVMGAAGCGSSSGTSSTASGAPSPTASASGQSGGSAGDNFCDGFTNEDVKAATGLTVTSTDHQAFPERQFWNCYYSFIKNSSGFRAQVQRTLSQPQAQYLASFKDRYSGAQDYAIPGAANAAVAQNGDYHAVGQATFASAHVLIEYSSAASEGNGHYDELAAVKALLTRMAPKLT
ncbi:MAG: hypothetical protein QOE92_1657 [Chloroflexota bacterium]|jgi:hypothetical protein|nr:hypothetical protein [Chloroflexota bacterium]